MMSVERIETTAGIPRSAMSAKDGSPATAGRDAAAGAAVGAAAAADASAEAVRVKSRLPARIIPKATAARTSAEREITLVLVCMASFFMTTGKLQGPCLRVRCRSGCLESWNCPPREAHLG
ncbi:hypothetical protein EG835_10485, partial [bacterium]|nr:hypothetical protein [bacterium]